MERKASMDLTYPKESCSNTFECFEERFVHQEKHYSSFEATTQEATTKKTKTEEIAVPLADGTDCEITIAEKSDMVSSYEKRQAQDEPQDHRHGPSKASAVLQTGTQLGKGLAPAQDMPGQHAESNVDAESVDHPQPSRVYEPLPTAMSPRTFETELRIRNMEPRYLENGLKDSSLGELLGNSSSEQGSEAGESNYWWG